MSDRRDRIWEKIMGRVERRDGGCWIWTGPTSGRPRPGDRRTRGHGYPRMSLDGGTVAVHIAAYVIHHGPIPPRKQIDHRCRNRLCVNPDHLEMVTHRRNQRRRDLARGGDFACEAA